FDDLTFSIEPIEEELDVPPLQPDTDVVQIQDTKNELKKEVDNSKDKIQKIRNNLRKALGPRRAAQAWKCAERIYQLLQVCGLPYLYFTMTITFSNLEELNEENFLTLLREVRIHGVHS
ncbi:3475_t:CDS:2, partial [Ambispora leptoticha]